VFEGESVVPCRTRHQS